ncbi:hypothetical protein [Methylobacterium sp. ID0610]
MGLRRRMGDASYAVYLWFDEPSHDVLKRLATRMTPRRAEVGRAMAGS